MTNLLHSLQDLRLGYQHIHSDADSSLERSLIRHPATMNIIQIDSVDNICKSDLHSIPITTIPYTNNWETLNCLYLYYPNDNRDLLNT